MQSVVACVDWLRKLHTAAVAVLQVESDARLANSLPVG
jgi:hypothetical protein